MKWTQARTQNRNRYGRFYVSWLTIWSICGSGLNSSVDRCRPHERQQQPVQVYTDLSQATSYTCVHFTPFQPTRDSCVWTCSRLVEHLKRKAVAAVMPDQGWRQRKTKKKTVLLQAWGQETKDKNPSVVMTVCLSSQAHACSHVWLHLCTS